MLGSRQQLLPHPVAARMTVCIASISCVGCTLWHAKKISYLNSSQPAALCSDHSRGREEPKIEESF